jgi:nitroreductase
MDPSERLHPLIRARRSPRALDPAAEVTVEQLRALFDAARWAASRGNLQPARYLVGRRGTPTFARIFDVLRPKNRTWTAAASALALGIAVTADEEGRPFPHARYDLGQATAQLALQAVAEGLVVHQMAGFDPDAARTEFAIPPDHDPVVAIAIGVPGPLDALPADLQAREVRPRTRRPLGDLVFTDEYGTPAFE